MKIKSILLSSLLLSGVFTASSQDLYFTKTAKVNFDCTPANPVEKIDAVNNEATSFLNKASGELVFAVLVKSFRFEKALMEEHFNENYMESGKFPKSTFKGSITNNSSVDYKKDGTYPVTAKGKLTMHGVTKDVTVPGKITIVGNKAVLKADFNVNLDDYNIKVPANNASQVAKTIKVSMDCSLVKK